MRMDKHFTILFFFVVIGIAWVTALPSVDETDIQNQNTEFEDEDDLEPYDVADNEDQFQEKDFVEEVTRRRKRCGRKRCRRFQICKNSKCVAKPKKEEDKPGCIKADKIGDCVNNTCCSKFNDANSNSRFKPFCGMTSNGSPKCNRCSRTDTECRYECCESETDPNKGGCTADGKCTDELIKTGGTCDPNDPTQKCSLGNKMDRIQTGFCNETSKTCGVCIKTGDDCSKKFPCCPDKGKPDRGGCNNRGKCTPDCVPFNKSCETGDTCCNADNGKSTGYCDPTSKTCKLCSDEGEVCGGYSSDFREKFECCRDYSGKPIKGGCMQKRDRCSKSCFSQGETCEKNEECCYDYYTQNSKRIICNPETKKCDGCFAATKICSKDPSNCCFKDGSTTERMVCIQNGTTYKCG